MATMTDNQVSTMNRRAAIALLFCGSLCGWARGEEAHLLKDGDFSAALAHWTVSDGAGSCTVGVDRDVKCGRKQAVLLRRDNPRAKVTGRMESEPLAVKPGQIYLLEFQVKGKEILSRAGELLAVRFAAPDRSSTPPGRTIVGQWEVGAWPSAGPGPGGGLPCGTFDWQPYRLYLRAYDRSETATVQFVVPSAGSLWISDVRLAEVAAVRGVKSEIHGAIAIPNTYGAAPDGYLTDGIFCWNQGADNQKISQGYRGLEKGITIRLSLPKVTRVDRLVLSLVRVNCGHTLRKIEVCCDKLGRRIKAAEGPGYLTEAFDQRLWIVESPVRQTTDSIELKLYGDGYLVPLEILVLEGEGGPEEMKKYLMSGWVVLAAAAAATATAAEPPVVVENDVVRMEFRPTEGGVCKRMLYKPAGKELVYAYTDAGYGLLRDCFWSPTAHDYADVAYRHELTRTPHGTSIHLYGRGAGGIYSFTEIHKTVTLADRSPLIKVRYEIKNNVDSMTDADYGFWVHNFLGVMGGKNRYFIPTTQGILEVCNDPDQKPRDAELWVRNPARGWMAGIGDGRHGLVWSVDYKYLNLFYQFLGIAVPTCEWRYNRVNVRSGQSFKTDVTLMPFTGLDRVDGFFHGVAGSIGLPGEVQPGARITPQIGLVAAGNRRLVLQFRSRVLPAATWVVAGSKEVTLIDQLAQATAWPQQIALPAGTTVVGCQVLEEGQPIGALERPIVAGAASGPYALAPECPQAGSKEPPTVATGAPAAEHKLSLDVVSPHVPWGKPYGKGTLKTLVLADCGRQREIVELMQRFDLNVETEKLFCTPDTDYFTEEGECSVRTPQQAQARLKQKLRQPLDVIMIAGLHWMKTFDAESRGAILGKLRAGTGLVYVAPVGAGSDLQQVLPFAVGEAKWESGFLTPTQRHFLTCGIPYALLPQVGGIAYQGPSAGHEALLVEQTPDARKQIPLLVTGQAGKGRWVCLAWDVYQGALTAEDNSRSRITPNVLNEWDPKTSKPGVLKDRAGREITWRCWEYFFSLVGKGLLWAAHREPELLAEVGQGDADGSAVATVQSPAAHRSAILEMTWRNKFSEDEGREVRQVELVQGINAVRFAAPARRMPGVTLADLRVLAPDGKVITWASGFCETRPPLAIAEFTIDQKVLPRAEPVVRGRVQLSGTPGPDDALEVRLTDFFGRLVFKRSFSAAQMPTPFEARPLDVMSIPMSVELRLTRAGQTLDRRRETVLFTRPRTWDPQEYILYEWYWALVRGVQFPYLYELGRTLAGQIGVASVMDSPSVGLLDLEENAFHSPLGIWDINDQNVNKKMADYAKTKDRGNLVRQPCLWDQAYREKAAQAMRRAAAEAMTCGGGYAYCLGDEMALASYSSYFDFDFAPASVAAFRRWLQKRYGSLRALNDQWETAYQDWAQIEPMTAEEAQRRAGGNYSPWADFRTFMDDSLNDFFAYLQKCLEEVDPLAKISISGTQDATAGTGLDWWKLCHTLKVLHS